MYPDFTNERENLAPLFPIRVRYLIPPKGPGEHDADVVAAALHFTADMYGVQNAIGIPEGETAEGTLVSFFFRQWRDSVNFHDFITGLDSEIK